MKIIACAASRINIGDSLTMILDNYLPSLKEKCIVAVTSKIISLCEKSVVFKNALIPDQKYALIKQHADAFLDPLLLEKEKYHNIYNVYLTIKNNILIPSAGIDESNGSNVYILYPENIQKTAEQIWTYLREKNRIQKLGVLITDSHTTPLRRGVTGIGLGWCGFEALYNYIGKPDCFGHTLKVTQVNNLDALAAGAVYVMGEGNEQMPLAVISEIPRIEFQPRPPSKEEINEIAIPLEQDLYAPLLNKPQWIWNKPKKQETHLLDSVSEER